MAGMHNTRAAAIHGSFCRRQEPRTFLTQELLFPPDFAIRHSLSLLARCFSLRPRKAEAELRLKVVWCSARLVGG